MTIEGDPYEEPGRIYGLIVNEEACRLLNIRVVSATNLLKKDIFGLSDPYVRISLCSEVSENADQDDVVGIPAETKPIKKTLNPVWNTDFRFRVSPSRQYLLFEVYDQNKLTNDDFLGLFRFNLFQLPVNNIASTIDTAFINDFVLKPRSRRSRVRGRLQVQFMYEPADYGVSIRMTEEIEADSEVQSGQWDNLADQAPLPDGWEERVDFSGRIVYVDHVNRITTLDRPTPASSADINAHRGSILQRQHSSFENRRQISEDNIIEATDLIDNVLQAQHTEVPSTSAEPSTGEWDTLDQDIAEEMLPDGWEMRHDFAGRPIYVNHSSRITQFERPTAPTPTPRDQERNDDLGFENLNIQDGANNATLPTTAPTSLSLADETDNGPDQSPSPLPSGWTRGKDPRTGSTFYIDHNSRTTSWTKPNVRTDGLFATMGPLPEGWEMRHTKNGRPFFINHRTKQTTWNDPRQEDPLPDGWEMRVHQDGRVFYVDHITKSTQWEDPRKTKVSSGPAIQYSRDYKLKYESFKGSLPKPSSSSGKCDIQVKRRNILEDSFNSLMTKSTDDMMRRLWITFEGEPGLDYGGVAREWFYLLSREMFNPYYGLFEYSAIDNYTLQINPNSGLCNPDHLRFFQFFGRVCAMAVYHGKLVDGFFIRPFYKMILSKPVTLEDMTEVDMETYNSLKWVIDNDPEDLCLTFCAEEDRFGQIVEVPLVTDGQNIDVTNDNKMGYISAYIRWKFVDRISGQMASFTKGFNEVIPLSKLSVFDENELEYVMCGITQIDVNDWEEYSEYKSGYSKSHHVVVWFWKAIRSFDNEFRARLLQFVTGTSRVPMNGFRELQGSNGPQRFCIEKWGSNQDLPRAHTCFNRIDLPPYKDYHVLREKLRVAVECTGGFDID